LILFDKTVFDGSGKGLIDFARQGIRGKWLILMSERGKGLISREREKDDSEVRMIASI